MKGKEPRFSEETYAHITQMLGELNAAQRKVVTTVAVRAWLDGLAQIDGPLVAADVAYRLADEYVA